MQWGRLYGSARALAIAEAVRRTSQPVLAVVDDVQAAAHLTAELGFFLDDPELPVLGFPDWETLPYDVFSPLPELVSDSELAHDSSTNALVALYRQWRRS